MAGADDEARPHDVVPISHEDLRRDTPQDRDMLDRRQRRLDAGGLNDLLCNRRFMDQSRRISTGATVLGVMLILAGERRPILETFHAVRAAAVSAHWSMARRQDASGAISRIVSGAELAKAADAKTLMLVRRGVSCLVRAGLCPSRHDPSP